MEPDRIALEVSWRLDVPVRLEMTRAVMCVLQSTRRIIGTLMLLSFNQRSAAEGAPNYEPFAVPCPENDR